jgi:hypothetical protein
VCGENVVWGKVVLEIFGKCHLGKSRLGNRGSTITYALGRGPMPPKSQNLEVLRNHPAAQRERSQYTPRMFKRKLWHRLTLLVGSSPKG